MDIINHYQSLVYLIMIFYHICVLETFSLILQLVFLFYYFYLCIISYGSYHQLSSFSYFPYTSQRNVCMSAGIKTPKRQELILSNTTFVNFDITDCVAIRTCSGCSQGQGKWYEQIRWIVIKVNT